MGEDIKQGFIEAYDRHADELYRFISFRVFNENRAEELLQETFVKTWAELAAGKRIENMRAFLFRVARNLVIDEARRKKSVSLEEQLENNPHAEPKGDDAASIERAVLAVEVMDELERLPEAAREILVLRFVNDLEPREIAEVLGITANNASVRVNRALALLKIAVLAVK